MIVAVQGSEHAEPGSGGDFGRNGLLQGLMTLISQFLLFKSWPNSGRGAMPEYIRKDKVIRAIDVMMSFTMSRADYDLHDDIHITDAMPGHIHIHKNSTSNNFSTWMKVNTGQWEDLSSRFPYGLDQEPFVMHPKYPQLVLTLGRGQEPSYILETSLKARMHKDHRIKSNSNAPM